MHIALTAVSAATTPTGVCRHAANLARNLQSLDGVDQVTLITGEWQADYFQHAFALTGERLRIFPINIPNNSLSRNVWYLLGLPTRLRDIHADILHLTFPVPFLRSSASLPVVLTLHDLYPLDLPGQFGNRAWLNRLALRESLREADITVCVSDNTRQRLLESGHKTPQPATVIPHPIALPTQSDYGSLPRELERYPFLLSVAQHRANKNLLTLLQGFRAALDANLLPAETRLVIVGNQGPETNVLLHEIAFLDLTNRVLLLRGLSDPTIASLYLHCELFVSTSLIEGFGLPVAEAIAHGCRVLCTDIPTHRETCATDCTFIPTNAGAAELAAGISTALRAPRPSHNNRFLTPLQAANQYLTVYQGLRQSTDLRPASITTSEPISTGDA